MVKSFKELGISEELVEVMMKMGIKEPTPVQEESIPHLMEDKDVIAQAQTGTGKTLAFVLPIIEKIDVKKPYPQGLIITPTRELAIQITNEAKKISEGRNISILAAYGGQDVLQQVRKLKNGIHLIIATPGRLLDHMKRGTVNLGKLQALVIDEADEILQMGFLNDVAEIISGTPKTRQTMLFSATIPDDVRSMGKRFMKNPVQIEIEGDSITLDEIEQVVIETTDRGKLNVLSDLIDKERPYLAIVFCRTKRRVSSLHADLRARGYNADELHGDLTQGKRERVMKSFRDAKIQILIATDIAARGLDVEGITHVINYDIPEDAESYIHRIGRTGRIGNLGKAVTLVTEEDRSALALIERKIKKDFDPKVSQRKNTNDLRAAKRKDDNRRQGQKRGKNPNFKRKTSGKRKNKKRR